MQAPSPGSSRFSGAGDPLSEDTLATLDIDHFDKMLSGVKSKGAQPELLGSIIAYYASKWLPEVTAATPSPAKSLASPEGSVATWMKKRLFVEALIGVLPPERDAVPCELLMRLLRAASMVGAGPALLEELEARVAAQLDRATLADLMIPAFSHTCGTLLDVGLVLRLVRGYVGASAGDEAAVMRSGAGMVKVARLADSYLSEAALEAGLTAAEFEELACAVPAHARAMDDGLYRAIDTYLKAHPNTTKEQRKALCRLIDTRKLSPDATAHAAHNDRLPVRSIIHVLFSDQAQLGRSFDWDGSTSFRGPRSPKRSSEPTGRCPSKRDLQTQQQEMRKLRDDVGRLQAQCQALQAQVERLRSEKRKAKGLFRWSSFLFGNGGGVVDDYEVGLGCRTPKAKPVQGKGTTPPKWRNSSA